MDHCHDGSHARSLASRNWCNRPEHSQTEITVKLGILEFSARLFGLLWIGAAIASIYFLYVALAKAAPWSNLLWSIVAGLVARTAARILKQNLRRLNYIDQLIERGYEPARAEAAWRTATGGGMNLLRDLQQAEIADDTTRQESPTGAADSQSSGD